MPSSTPRPPRTAPAARPRRPAATSADAAPGPEGGSPGASPALPAQPGHLIRRAHQIAVSVFHEQLGYEVTPLQYAVLRTLEAHPGVDQVTLAQLVALDTSTTAELARRMEAKGWIHRELLARRQRALSLSEAGRAVLAELVPGMQRMQSQLMGRLDEAEREQFLRLLRKFVELNNERSRAPLRTPPARPG